MARTHIIRIDRKFVKMKAKLKGRMLNAGSGVCSGMSVLGSYQICHNLCMGVIAVLTGLGIAVTGMPLLFLTRVAIPFWFAALAMMAVALVLTFGFKMKMSKKMLLANAGLIVAGIPFASVQNYKVWFWTIGGLILLTSIEWAIMDWRQRK